MTTNTTPTAHKLFIVCTAFANEWDFQAAFPTLHAAKRYAWEGIAMPREVLIWTHENALYVCETIRNTMEERRECYLVPKCLQINADTFGTDKV